VAQTIAKRIQRRALEIPVRPSIHRVASERRKLRNRTVERHWQATGWVVLARQHLRNGRAAFFSWIPRLQHRTSMFLRPVGCNRTSISEHDDQRLARRCKCLQHVLLGFRQVEVYTIAAEE